MSLRVGWNFGATTPDERRDVVMQDPPCWNATHAVLKAGRGLSTWLFRNTSPPSSPSFSSFLCREALGARPPTSTSPPRIPQPTPSTLETSPPHITSLPQELLEEVFREYIHEPNITSPSLCPLRGSMRRITTFVGTKTTPFTLAHVCSVWRTVVTSNPRLWARLAVLRPEPSDLPVFEYWISRSSNYPLDLTIIGGAGVGGKRDTAMASLIMIALKHAERWRAVSLQLDQETETLFKTISFYRPLPLLRRFHLDLHNWTEEGCRAISHVFSGPKLQGAAWGDSCLKLPFHFQLPWSQLGDIQISHISVYDLQSVLRNASSLVSLSIGFLETGPGSQDPPFRTIETQPTELPALALLTLTHYDDLRAFFESLCVPALSSLTLKTGFGPSIVPDAGWASLARLVQRSRCHITSFDWSDNRMAECTLVNHLTVASTSIFPSLHHLRVGSPVSAVTIEAFTLCPGSATAPFLALQSLAFGDCNTTRSSVQKMLESRPQLHAVDIELWDEEGIFRHVVLGGPALTTTNSCVL